MDKEGNIFARGTQDMKCVTMQYIFALKRLKKMGKLPFERTVHLTCVPDEEVGGFDGLCKLVNDKQYFKQLNIGMGLDEGLACEGNSYTVFYGERAVQWIRIKAVGPAGHGSRFIKDTAVAKLIDCVNEILQFRSEQEAILEKHSHDHGKHNCAKKTLGDVTSVNLTMLKAGVTPDGGKTYAYNVIPTEAEAGFDVRLSPFTEMSEFEKILNKWTKDSQITYK
eukprot:UN30705